MSRQSLVPEPANRRAERHVPDALLAAAVFYWPRASIKDLAARVGLDRRTLSERLNSPSLKAMLAEHRAEAFAEALERIKLKAVSNIDAVQRIIDDTEAAPRDRLAGVRLMFDVGLKLDELVNRHPQLVAMQATLEQIKDGRLQPDETPPPTEPDTPTPLLPTEPPPPDAIAPDVLDRIRGMIGKHTGGE